MLRLDCNSCAFITNVKCVRDLTNKFTVKVSVIYEDTIEVYCPHCNEKIYEEVDDSEMIELLAKL